MLIERSGYRLETLLDDRIDDVVVEAVEWKQSMDDLVEWFRGRLVARLCRAHRCAGTARQ